jgi:uncharacterized membrane protein (UPF0127 family)
VISLLRVRKWLAFTGLAILCSCAPQAPAPPTRTPQPPVSRPTLPIVPLEIRSGAQVHRFMVEVALSPAQQERGLMFRNSVAPDTGMIFPFVSPRIASFWMRNTLVPLDMLFIRSDGRIARIAANTVPYSLDPVTSPEPVAAVLELAGGRTAQLGIREGDVVQWVAP